MVQGLAKSDRGGKKSGGTAGSGASTGGGGGGGGGGEDAREGKASGSSAAEVEYIEDMTVGEEGVEEDRRGVRE